MIRIIKEGKDGVIIANGMDAIVHKINCYGVYCSECPIFDWCTINKNITVKEMVDRDDTIEVIIDEEVK